MFHHAGGCSIRCSTNLSVEYPTGHWLASTTTPAEFGESLAESRAIPCEDSYPDSRSARDRSRRGRFECSRPRGVRRVETAPILALRLYRPQFGPFPTYHIWRSRIVARVELVGAIELHAAVASGAAAEWLSRTVEINGDAPRPAPPKIRITSERSVGRSEGSAC